MILEFPREKQGLCQTKHGRAEGIILWALLAVFLVFKELDAKNNVMYRAISGELHLYWWIVNLVCIIVISYRLYILFIYISALENLETSTKSPLNYTCGVVFPFFIAWTKKVDSTF